MDKVMTKLIDNIIHKFFEGKASSEDLSELFNWMNQDNSNKRIFDEMSLYWRADVTFDGSIDYSEVFMNLKERIKVEEKKRSGKNKKRKILISLLPLAALIIGFVFSWSVFSVKNNVKEFHCLSGNSITEVNLPDGSLVVLKENTSLIYNSTFNKEKRDVKIIGEAYFKVNKNKEKPFTIDLETSKVTVLGTSFNVRSLNKDGISTITLVEGSIQFNDGINKIILKPKEELVYDSSKKEIKINQVNPFISIAWKNNLIKYQSVSFEEVIKQLEEIYNVNIKILNTNLKTQIITGTFDKRIGIEKILELMRLNLNFTWKKDASDFYILH